MIADFTSYGMHTLGRSLAYLYYFEGTNNSGFSDMLNFVITKSSEEEILVFRKGFDDVACGLWSSHYKNDAYNFIMDNDVTFEALLSLINEGYNISCNFGFETVERKLGMYLFENEVLKSNLITDVFKPKAIEMLALSTGVREHACKIHPFYTKLLKNSVCS